MQIETNLSKEHSYLPPEPHDSDYCPSTDSEASVAPRGFRLGTVNMYLHPFLLKINVDIRFTGGSPLNL